ncbi:hypothetical protein BWQ96_03192 [Gracilariopsis chorda]|uniref:Uncharacterized protein n=1 Tax=Gracilariopsis chorda TaxID=448386 RepID=A0A2V3IXX9_9FLOR|nr:hypothetical protein BWQ96_03192 [Gracilariopsis chorda]|eukprot:PXF47002.1 hypothetical protein BWQ96_03192 [Gracilariopsis chorda]
MRLEAILEILRKRAIARQAKGYQNALPGPNGNRLLTVATSPQHHLHQKNSLSTNKRSPVLTITAASTATKERASSGSDCCIVGYSFLSNLSCSRREHGQPRPQLEAALPCGFLILPKVALAFGERSISSTMTFGNYSYGLRMRWGRHKPPTDPKECLQQLESDSAFRSLLGPLKVPGHDISVLCIGNESLANAACLCYCFCVPLLCEDGFIRNRKAVVRRELAERLYWRFSSQVYNAKRTDCSAVLTIKPSSTPRGLKGSYQELLPGYSDTNFLQSLCTVVQRKFEDRFNSLSRTVTPDLYALWSLTSCITVELFADSLNESGVLPNYCSRDEGDDLFGSIGIWEDVEDTIEGAGGNPPFETQFLHRMLDEFDKGARGSKPYCRCVLLPLGKTHGILERTHRLSSKAIMLVKIPAGCLSFKHQQGYFAFHSHPQKHGYQDLGIFIWRNREYLGKYPPPNDVELLYMSWIARACHGASRAVLLLPSFEKAFPKGLRDGCGKLSFFDVP